MSRAPEGEIASVMEACVQHHRVLSEARWYCKFAFLLRSSADR